METGSEWLYAKKRWRSSYLVWSDHKSHKKLDRVGVGRATSADLQVLSHERLMRLVEFDLTVNNRARAAGRLWVRSGCLPMGGPFSAQAVDLHSLWCVFKKKNLFRQLETLIGFRNGFSILGWGAHSGPGAVQR